MLASGISGKLFDVIKNMYEKAKSSVAITAEAQSDFSPVTVYDREKICLLFCSPTIYTT